MRKMVFFLTLWCSYFAYGEGDYHVGEAKSAVCATCHGQKGISINPQWPSLAGQHPAYFIKQLKDFKEGKNRNAGVMAAMVSGLTEQDMEDLAEFYSKQTLPKGITPNAFLKRGELLYRGGDFDKHIPACIACHGPKGTGNAQAGFPSLSGQHPEYTVLELQQFKSKQRHNDLNAIMQDICERMDLEDMQAVAHYIAGLH